MTEPVRPPFSYRDDPAVPCFPEHVPLIVYDGVCRLCSGWVRFILRQDGDEARHLFASAQSELGHALYRHYGFSPTNPETLLVVQDGRLHTKAGAIVAILAGLGTPWSIGARALALLPAPLSARAYDLLARNRYRIAGRRETCMMPRPGTESRFIA